MTTYRYDTGIKPEYISSLQAFDSRCRARAKNLSIAFVIFPEFRLAIIRHRFRSTQVPAYSTCAVPSQLPYFLSKLRCFRSCRASLFNFFFLFFYIFLPSNQEHRFRPPVPVLHLTHHSLLRTEFGFANRCPEAENILVLARISINWQG